MGARHGRKFCRKTKTRAESMLSLTRTIPTLSLGRFGRRVGSRGFFPAVGREVGSTAPKTTGLRGNILKATAFLTEFSARLGWRFQGLIQIASTRSSKQRKADSTVRM